MATWAILGVVTIYVRVLIMIIMLICNHHPDKKNHYHDLYPHAYHSSQYYYHRN